MIADGIEEEMVSSLRLERTEEELAAKRRAYRRRRVVRITDRIRDNAKKQSIELLLEEFEKWDTRALQVYILSGDLPDVSEDRIAHAVSYTMLTPETIRGVAGLIVQEREKDIEDAINRKRNRISRGIAIAALLISLAGTATAVWKAFFAEPAQPTTQTSGPTKAAP